jgi:predicted RND superfamily exporter protein
MIRQFAKNKQPHGLCCLFFKSKANNNSLFSRFRRVHVEKIARFIVEKRKLFLLLFAAAGIVSILLAPAVEVNYDNTKYLPQDMHTSKSITVMEQEFGLNGLAQVMVKESSIPEALRLKEEMERIPGVEDVLWLDDFVDLATPLSLADSDLVEKYYKNGHALFQIVFSADDYNIKTGEAIERLEKLNEGNVFMRGPAAEAFRTRQTATSEILVITLLVIPIFLLILLFSTSSWIEPLIFVATIGISILINMGTNIILGEISFITQASSGLLQFAVTMDYSIFLLHRFGEERSRGIETKQAMINALQYSFSSISASSLTTVAGFAALMFMRYGIGFDMGAVLAKGVVLSFISVMTLLPALIIFFEKAIVRTHHRPFMPELKRFAEAVIKLPLALPLVAVILPVAFLAQGSNHFIYGDGLVSGKTAVYKVFGNFNPLLLMVPAGDIPSESALTESLSVTENIRHIESLTTIADSAVPREMLPQALLDNFLSENFARMIVHLDAPAESPAAFTAVREVRSSANAYYHDQYFLLGSSSALLDIKEVVEHDFTLINMIAILAVGTIIMFTFRSLAIPVILVLAIQASIWVNMAIPYFMGASLVFIGYMIVSAVQLGATIDYAILLTGRYMQYRQTLQKREAAVMAISDAGNSIITSAAIMSAAGFTLGYVSDVPGIAALGMLIGRGALLSCAMVLTLLPHLLMAGDGLIRFTTLRHGFLKQGGKFE